MRGFFLGKDSYFLSKRLLSTKAERFVPKSGTYPKGFVVGGSHVAIKKNGDLDLAILANKGSNPAIAAGLFTTNKFKAAPVQLCTEILKEKGGENINSLIINSGNANAVTGSEGMEDAEKMIAVTDSELGNALRSTLVMSTGVIGNPLPIDKIVNGIPKLAKEELGNSHEHWVRCATAICTTDTFPKLISKQFDIEGRTYSLTGVAKGAGMICPNLATLLGFFATDAPVTSNCLSRIMDHAVNRSFNCIAVDTDMSTNDTIIGIANGEAGGSVIDCVEECAELYKILQDEVSDLAQKLAQLVVRDGEGATKFVTIKVKDALSFDDAKAVASTVANSSLFKTAMYGEDANWGRILCAIGYSQVDSPYSIIPQKTSVSFVPSDGSLKLALLVDGEPVAVDEARASEILAAEDLEVEINLGTEGGQECSFWTCDLSHDYVTINGSYRS